jgi:hypothetical protein
MAKKAEDPREDMLVAKGGMPEAMARLFAALPRCPVLRLKPDLDENKPEYLTQHGMSLDKLYMAVCQIGNIHHYMVVEYGTWKPVDGIVHAERFELVDEDDL